ncbi:DgyrCDS3428 [Dimorphilus gyrociliatus]|uniref:Beta-sarcoglycan n=1 Tax=Dimorphilus gyrociliatus TaxID=2664684 RepID=A0A7I8VG78_9ANNE|nr:DgyrCDS3428 [Dimorphilus gyrociliatus]
MLDESQGPSLPSSPYGTLRSITAKSAEKEKTNKEHLGNFNTGYVNIDEYYLHRTGIRGKKINALNFCLFLICLSIITNLALTFLLISVLRISETGMAAIRFGSDLMTVKQSFTVEGACDIDSALYSNPHTNLKIELEGNESFEMLTFYENSGSKVIINENGIILRVADSFKIVNDEGEIVFTSNYSEQLRLPKVNNLKVKQSKANHIINYGTGITISSKLSSYFDAEDIEYDGGNFQAISKDLDIETKSSLILQASSFSGKTLPIAKITNGNSSKYAVQLCVCMYSGKLIAMTAESGCIFTEAKNC